MGPNTESWGTPDNTGAGFEQAQLTTTFYVSYPLEDIISDTLILQLIRWSSMWHLIESLGKVHNKEVYLLNDNSAIPNKT